MNAFNPNDNTKQANISVIVTSAGVIRTYATAPTSVTANDTQIATTAWVNSKMQVVSALPANPDPNVFYFIPE